MTLTRTLARNVFSNWMGFAVHAAVAFLLTPFMLHRIGKDAYGVWSLVAGLTGYYGLLDLGFRSGLTQYLARYLARKDFEQMNRTASTGMAALLACAAVLATVSLVLVAAAPYVFKIDPGMVSAVRWCLLVMGLSTAVQFLFFVFTAVLTACQRYDLSNAVGVTSRLVWAGSCMAALEAGYGIVGISVATAAVNLADYIARAVVAYRILPELRLARRLVNWSSLWEFTHIGAWNIVIAGSRRIIHYTDSIVIATVLSVEEIAPFALAVGLAEHFTSVFRPIGQVFFPAFAQAEARNDHDLMQKMYLYGTKMLALVSLSGGAVAWVLADDFFRIWIGPETTGGGSLRSVPSLFRWLLVASVPSVIQGIGYQVIMSHRRLRTLAILFIGEALVNLVLSVALAKLYGLVGIALGTTIPALVFHGVLHPAVNLQLLKISLGAYLRACVVPVGLTALAMAGPLWLFRANYHSHGWPTLIAGGALSSLICGLCAAVAGLSAAERKTALFDPLGRLLQSMRRRLSPRRPGAATAEAEAPSR